MTGTPPSITLLKKKQFAYYSNNLTHTTKHRELFIENFVFYFCLIKILITSFIKPTAWKPNSRNNYIKNN